MASRPAYRGPRYLLVAALWLGAAHAAPFVPADDAQVLERLPYKATDPLAVELRDLRAKLAKDPANADAAALLARRYHRLAEAQGDPRYVGHARAVLRPWWDAAQPPTSVLVQRAVLRQHDHDFTGAVADLSIVLAREPDNGSARAWRMVVYMVQADYARAREDCQRLRDLASDLVVTACASALDGLTGNAARGYEALRAVIDRHREAPAGHKLIALIDLAELAQRLGRATVAEAHFREALGLGISHGNLYSLYADFLLDQKRPGEVVKLLAERTRSDALLLRLALAEAELKSAAAPRHVAALQARFDALRARGDSLHLREEALFTLRLLNQPRKALELARENWKVQREPRDARVFLEAAVAANDSAAAQPVLEWLAGNRHEDPVLNALAQRLKQERR